MAANNLSSQVAPLPKDLPFRIVSGTIGTGAYAFIRRAVPVDSDKPLIAIKFIHKQHAFSTGRLKPKQLLYEITLHKHIGRHRNIIQFYHAGDDLNYQWIAMELAAGGDLFDKIEADVGVPEDVTHFYFTQLINALEYMHSKGVAHRDIKPENVLVSDSGNLKVADFGLAALFEHQGARKLSKSVVGSPPYMAPEIVYAGRTSGGYDPSVTDIWSAGIVLFVLLVGNTPWDEPTPRSYEFKDYANNGGQGPPDDEYWCRIPERIRPLLHGILKLEAKERLTVEQIRQDPWYSQQNHHLSKSGEAADPIRLATQMVQGLKVDFHGPRSSQVTNLMEGLNVKSAQPSPSQRNSDTMEVDEMRPSPEECRDIDSLKRPSDAPETPMMESPFDWERSTATWDSELASTQISPELTNILAEDPTLSQFTQVPMVPLTRTQAARKFCDIIGSQSMNRFVSLLRPQQVAELTLAALAEKQIYPKKVQGGDVASLRISCEDNRGQGLRGYIVFETHNQQFVDVRFLKAKGDPLGWRRLFKDVCFAIERQNQAAIYKPPEQR